MNFNYDNTVSAGENLRNYQQFFSKKFYSSNIELKISMLANSFSPVKIDFYGYLLDYTMDLIYDPALTKERVLDIIYDLEKVIKGDIPAYLIRDCILEKINRLYNSESEYQLTLSEDDLEEIQSILTGETTGCYISFTNESKFKSNFGESDSTLYISSNQDSTNFNTIKIEDDSDKNTLFLI